MSKNIKQIFSSFALLGILTITSCKKDGNPNNLPDVSTDDYVGKIDGYTSSDEVYPNNLIAYWSFDDTKAELKTGNTPAQTANDSYATDAVRGKSLSLAAGYLYYTAAFPKFKADSLKSWSISAWVKIANNGSKKTMVFQMARPTIFNGNVNFILNTNGYAATNDSVLRINPTFSTVGGGTQDNLNNLLDKISLKKWVHIVLTYDGNTGVFNNWANGVKVGNFPNRGIGTNLFKCWEPNELIIGSNYNGIPGKSVSTDATFAPMTGLIDEIRMYNAALPDAFVKSLYNLGVANK